MGELQEATLPEAALPEATLPEAILRIRAVWPHEGRPADLVRELKYGKATSVVTEIAEAMVREVTVSEMSEVDIVTWVPASPDRRRRRGFDQGELLARAVARRLHVPVRRLLRRVDDVPQTARELEGRLAGPDFTATGRRLRFKPTVLLVDDVTTTGSTLRSAASVLLNRGSGPIQGLVATQAIVPPGPAESRMGVYDRGNTRTTFGG